MTAFWIFLRTDLFRSIAFITTIAFCNGAWFYTRIVGYGDIGYGRNFLFLNGDTMVLYQDFKYLYDTFFNFGEFPLWNPHFFYGTSSLYWYFQHSPLEFIAIILGKVFNINRVYIVFNAVLALEQCIFTLGITLLVWRFKGAWIALLLVLPVVLLPMSYEWSVWHTQRCIYLMPLMIYFTIDFVRHGRTLGLVGGLVTWSAFIFGNIAYEVVFIFYASALFFFALAITNTPKPGLLQILIGTWKQLDWRVVAALALALLASTLYFYVVSVDRLSGHIEIVRGGRDASLKIPLETFVADNTLEFVRWFSLPITLFNLDLRFIGQPFIGIINTFFVVYLLAGRLTKFVKIALLLMLFGLLFISSKWFLVKYVLYWFPGAAYYHQFTPIVMIAKVTLVVLAVMGATNFFRDFVKGEFPINIFHLAGALAASILLTVAFHEALLKTAAPEPYVAAQVTAMFISLFALVAVSWGALRYAHVFRDRKYLVILVGVGLAVLNFAAILNLANEHRSTFLAGIAQQKLTNEQIEQNFFVRRFDLPLTRTQDIYSQKLPPNRSVNSSWLSATGAFPCSTYLGTNTMAKSVTDLFRFSSLASHEHYISALAEGQARGTDTIDKSPSAKKYLACDLPIVRVSSNAVLVGSLDAANEMLASVFRGERGFVDVIVDEKSTAAGRTQRPIAEKVSPPAPLETKAETIFYSPNKAVFKVQTADNAWLIFTDGFDDRWTATVDGVTSKVHVANRGFKAVFVPAGSHEVAFVYRNPAGTLVIWSLVVLLPVSLLLCIWLALKDLWARPARPPFPA